MNWWVATYAVLYFGSLIYSVREQIQHREPAWYKALDLLADVCAISFIVFYWFIPVPASLQVVMPVAFVFSLLWLILNGPRQMNQALSDPEMTAQERKWFTGFGLVVGFIFAAPAYIWGAAMAWKAING